MFDSQRIDEILSGVMLDIQRRREQAGYNHKQRVVNAVKEFTSRKLGRDKKPSKEKAREKLLF